LKKSSFYPCLFYKIHGKFFPLLRNLPENTLDLDFPLTWKQLKIYIIKEKRAENGAF